MLVIGPDHPAYESWLLSFEWERAGTIQPMDDYSSSEEVMWSKRTDTSNALYVAARRFCRDYEALDETLDETHWQALASAISALRSAAEEAQREVG